MNPFLSVNLEALSAKFGESPCLTLNDGASVFQGDVSQHLYIVKSGVVKITIQSAKGAERLLFFGGRGSLIGDTTCFSATGGIPEGLYGTAIGLCEVMKITYSEFKSACRADPSLAMAVIDFAYSKVASLIEQLESAAFQDTSHQVASLIHALALEGVSCTRSGTDSNDVLAMTHQMLAASTGRTRVSVTYALNRLQKVGAIRLLRGKIEITSIGTLARYVQGENASRRTSVL